MTKFKISYLASLLVFTTALSHAIQVTSTDDGQEMINKLLGSGVTISNINFQGSTFSGMSLSSGIFEEGLSTVGFDEGVILTTGKAEAAQPSNDPITGLTMGPRGEAAFFSDPVDVDADGNPIYYFDSELAHYLDVNGITSEKNFDSAMLEFEFETATGDLLFEYVFASEEYNEFVGAPFNDAFALFVDHKNIAIVPGSEDPLNPGSGDVVAIKSVNNGNPDLTYPPSHQELYIDNDIKNPTTNFPADGIPLDIAYNGLTKVFTAKVSGLDPNVKHTMKFVVSDISDGNLDSAVFIKAGSFRSGRTPERDNIGSDFLFAYMPNSVNELSSLKAELHLTTETQTTVTVNYPSNNPTFTQDVDLLPGAVNIVTLPQDSILKWTEAPSASNGNQRQFIAGIYPDNLVSVVSQDNKEFMAFLHNSEVGHGDGAMGIPGDALGKEHLVSSYFDANEDSGMQEFIVYAVENNTLVQITAAGRIITAGNESSSTAVDAGQTYTVTLNAGEAFYGFSENIQRSNSSQVKESIAGTSITSSKPVGVISGNRASAIGGNSLDNPFEILPALDTWGNEFITTALPNRDNGSAHQIYASRNNTTIYQDGVAIGVINKNQPMTITNLVGYHTFTGKDGSGHDVGILGMHYITDQQQSTGATNFGDPAMGYIQPTGQMMKDYVFATPGNKYAENYIDIVVPTADLSSLFIDGTMAIETDFTELGTSGFSWANLLIAAGQHNVVSDNGFVLDVTGQGAAESYLYPAGALLHQINKLADVHAPVCVLNPAINYIVNGSARDLIYSEDINGDGIYQSNTEADSNNDGYFNINSGIYSLRLDDAATNLQLTTSAFNPGDLTVGFDVNLIDVDLNGNGIVWLMDAQGNNFSCNVDITGNGIPVAKALVNFNDVNKAYANPVKEITVSDNEEIVFDGSNSYDNNSGTIVMYHWDIDGSDGVDSPDLDGVTAVHSYAQTGDYVVTLTVVDNEGSTAQNTVLVHVEHTNILPIAIVKGSIVEANSDGHFDYREDKTSRLDGSGSYDPDGKITNYHWTITDEDGNVVLEFDSATPIQEITLANSGNYFVDLVVTDDSGYVSDNPVDQRSVDLTVFEEVYEASGSFGVFSGVFLFMLLLVRRKQMY